MEFLLWLTLVVIDWVLIVALKTDPGYVVAPSLAVAVYAGKFIGERS